jgi:DNA-binding beta-propeller fold protein YncE
MRLAANLPIPSEPLDQIAMVDAMTMSVTARYDLGGKGETPAGLAFDPKNRILFVACRNPATTLMLNADTGQILDALPIGTAVDGAAFNPRTNEAFSS